MSSESEVSVLIVTIVPRGQGERVMRASRQAGAEGGTILYGRGSGVHENRSILGVQIEPEKEVLLTVVAHELTDAVMRAIVEAGRLDNPGAGIIFSLRLDRVGGICHPRA